MSKKQHKVKKLSQLREKWEKEIDDFEEQLLEAVREGSEDDANYVKMPQKWALRLNPVEGRPPRWRDFWTGEHDIPLFVYEAEDNSIWVSLRDYYYPR